MPTKKPVRKPRTTKATGSAKPQKGARAAPPTPAQIVALDLLRRLSEAVGVSGNEGAVRKIIRETVSDLADEIKVDAIGNLFAIKHGPQRAPRVLVTAHTDEIGFMIVGIENDGLLKFEAVGGVDDRVLLGKPVWVGENRVPGVIGMKPIHLINNSELTNVVKIDSLRIDIGATSRDAASRMAKAGDRATFAAPFVELGPTVRGK